MNGAAISVQKSFDKKRTSVVNSTMQTVLVAHTTPAIAMIPPRVHEHPQNVWKLRHAANRFRIPLHLVDMVSSGDLCSMKWAILL